MDGQTTFFVLHTDARQMGDGEQQASFEYALVQIAQDKIERALWMQDGIDSVNERISELQKQKEQNFGGEVRDEIFGLGLKISKMRKERNEYLGSNAISYVNIVERGQQTFFEGDGIPASALGKMLDGKILEVGEGHENLMRA